MSLKLIQKCRRCGEGLAGFHASRKYCSFCADSQKREQYGNHRRKVKGVKIYNSMFINLTKNYILFVEGVKK
jgi:ribosomal protein L37E